MGACDFLTKAKGKTAKEAFSIARDNASYEHGHGGYTGTVAEKNDFKVIDVPVGEDPVKYADKLLREDDKRISDKWGPAGCIEIAPGEYLFFGYASS